ncbi:hypothetical protein TSTA_102140 [Talaromyces stipitatus ATCC 10500]|uniref:2EXR domain-containing protein n=1 Tax=Talaromyces stipitatus (strain ATCC 10500 / CBS 375.48 / QM 6759 / NRRL 1006) TaxID=441959 RepID=B8MN35_TALSN|nr:uncharacterized protein TSTA_102140 [Talaromyces stipitatus ATCC 10500]EED13984.1 hypothetical protein TSTA_102140 [Talaromyces stipitatus ATCC 10500]
MANETFHCFPQLPPELRRMIWEHCLPYRVAQVDPCDVFFDGRKPEQQICDVESVTIENTRQPVIAFVSTESRQVALEQGCWLRDENNWNVIKSFWFQRRRDVLHLNWTPERGDYWYRFEHDDGSSWVYMFLYQAHELKLPTKERSMVADAIYRFNLNTLRDSYDEWDDFIPKSPITKYREHESFALSEIINHTAYWPGYQLSIDVIMAAISLHITKESAVKSGIFGLLGDAPIQLIDVGDEVRLRKYEAICKEHMLYDKEPKVQKMFEVLLSPRFQEAVQVWKRKAEWLLFSTMWKHALSDNIVGLDMASLWVPPLYERDWVRMRDYSPNESHPWVKQAKEKMPILRPHIMVHYCTNECYIEGRLREDFKAGWWRFEA